MEADSRKKERVCSVLRSCIVQPGHVSQVSRLRSRIIKQNRSVVDLVATQLKLVIAVNGKSVRVAVTLYAQPRAPILKRRNCRSTILRKPKLGSEQQVDLTDRLR